MPWHSNCFRFGEAIDLCLKDYRPNQLTSYLFDLANCYSTFFENCPVLKAETPELRQSRLILCDLTARTIQKGTRTPRHQRRRENVAHTRLRSSRLFVTTDTLLIAIAAAAAAGGR